MTAIRRKAMPNFDFKRLRKMTAFMSRLLMEAERRSKRGDPEWWAAAPMLTGVSIQCDEIKAAVRRIKSSIRRGR